MAKIGVGILGGTGAVGQQLVALLDGHPQFHLAVIGASDRSAGQRYDNACVWRQTSPLAAEVASMIVVECIPENFVGKCALVFSALGTDIAGELEVRFAKAGIKVNPEHVELVKSQSFGGGGWIVTNANCSTTGLVVALKPLQDKFGISECMVTTLQAISGAGYTGIYAMDIADNVVPYIGNEEDKLETEPQKILGHIVGGKTEHLTSLRMSAQCNRVNVSDGHTICVSVKLINDPQDPAVVEAALRDFQPNLPANLPSLPPKPLVLRSESNRPQPKLDRSAGNGFAVSVGRVRPCPLYSYKFVCLVHNIVMGAAGSAILNAELAHAKGLVA